MMNDINFEALERHWAPLASSITAIVSNWIVVNMAHLLEISFSAKVLIHEKYLWEKLEYETFMRLHFRLLRWNIGKDEDKAREKKTKKILLQFHHFRLKRFFFQTEMVRISKRPIPLQMQSKAATFFMLQPDGQLSARTLNSSYNFPKKMAKVIIYDLFRAFCRLFLPYSKRNTIRHKNSAQHSPR